MKVIIFGPPGSGKGTQASLLEKRFKFFRLSPGDLLRQEIIKKTSLSDEILNVTKSGKLLDDNIIFRIIEKTLCKKKILFDGYPRTLTQALFLHEKKVNIDFIINILVSKSIILKRIKYRVINDTIGCVLNILKKKSSIRYKDDNTGLDFYKRLDDRYSIINRRFYEYEKNFKLMKEFYMAQGIRIINIDGDQCVNTIYKSIKNIIV